MEVKKRLIKGSEEAKKYMADLRNKRKGNKGGSNTPPAAPCPPPSNDEPTESIKKNKSKKNKIIVDFI